MSFLERKLVWVDAGGRHAPNCVPNHNTAVIIPFRNRTDHLQTLLHNLHPFLRRQQAKYAIFIVEQADNLPFNRGELQNIGFVEASKLGRYTCFIFHDVDLLPEDDRNIYTCQALPRNFITTLNDQTPSPNYFGGVVSILPRLFQRINGFSNRYWGWGKEDVDLLQRIRYHRLKFSRVENFGRYTMLKHEKAKKNQLRHKINYRNEQYFSTDGLNSLDYVLESLDTHKLYTRILVSLRKNKLFYLSKNTNFRNKYL